MIGNSKYSIQIDLNEFKLLICLNKKTQLTLLFNTPSRKFYLCVIALVVNEMKKLGKIKSIPLQDHLDLLALLNESVGDAAGASGKENLLPRIYRKWKDVLPNLEEAPLFRVIGKKKGEGEGAAGKIYSFSDVEKDVWANLFDYMGSNENVRLKFAIDKMGVSLKEIVIIYGDFVDAEGWDRFISSLKQGGEEKTEPVQKVAESGEEDSVRETGDDLIELGRHEVKNIAESVRICRAQVEPEAAPSKLSRGNHLFKKRLPNTALAIIGVIVVAGVIILYQFVFRPSPPEMDVASMERAGKPSIAVLPFANLSEDPKQEFFSDGISEDIINALVRWPTISIIPRASSFIYKGKSVDVKLVGRELGVRYVLEGSVRREGNKVRILAQLIDTTTRSHLFSERYEREMKDIFSIQDEITMNVLTAMRVSLSGEGVPSSRGKGTKNIDAYLKLLQAETIFQTLHPASQARARRLAEEAVALDPEYARAYTIIAASIGNEVLIGVYEDSREALKRALAMAEKAVQLDDSEEAAHRSLGFISILLNKDYDKGIAEARRAVELAPNSVMAHTILGYFLYSAGRTEEAIPILKNAVGLSPIPVPRALSHLGIAYRKAGRYEEAVAVCKQLLKREPNYLIAHLTLAATLVEMDEMEEARAQINEVLRIAPKYNVKVVARSFPWKDQAEIDRLIDSLRKAGLK